MGPEKKRAPTKLKLRQTLSKHRNKKAKKKERYKPNQTKLNQTNRNRGYDKNAVEQPLAVI